MRGQPLTLIVQDPRENERLIGKLQANISNNHEAVLCQCSTVYVNRAVLNCTNPPIDEIK
eukprot:245866-Prorocentrum_minimum.AAC.3